MTDMYSKWRDFYAEKVSSWMSPDELRAECGKLQTTDATSPEVLLIHAMHALEECVQRDEAMRAEVERLRADRDSWEQQASDRVADWHAEHLRAEQLAGALALLPDEIDMVEHNPDEGPRMFCCGRKVTLSWHYGLIPIHDKKCWYARMRALRERLAETADDLARCPNCGGPADNGHDREVPPNPYWCSKCSE